MKEQKSINYNMINKRGQVAVFIIILLIITGFVVIGFLFREKIGGGVQGKVDKEVSLIDSAID